MKIVFVHSGSENLGVEALSAYLKSKGHSCNLVFEPDSFGSGSGREIPIVGRLFRMSLSSLARKALEYEPDLVCFSSVTGSFKWGVSIARGIKAIKPDVPIVFGGIHPTAVPENVIKENAIDAIVIGEGEHALEEIASSIKNGRIENTAVKNAWIKKDGVVHRNPVRPYIRDLDALPPVDKKLFYDKAPALENFYMIMTSRGCPFHCTFCCHSLYYKLYNEEKNHVRRRSVDNVILELQQVRSRGVAKFIGFWDDVFVMNRPWIREFAAKYPKEIGMPFLCYAHPKSVNEEMADLLLEAGCETVKVGVQSLDPHTLKNIIKRTGDESDLMRTASILKERGIDLIIEHIIGFPGDGAAQQEKAARVYAEIDLKKVLSYWLVHYPGAEIVSISRDMGLLPADVANKIERGDDSVEYSYMFPGGDVDGEMRKLARYQILFDLMPFLPKRLRVKMVELGIVRFLRFNKILHQALLVLNAVRTLDLEDLNKVYYAFSKKYVP